MLVVGRRTPTGEIIRPASALNRLDLPLPVGPASATTVVRCHRQPLRGVVDHRPSGAEPVGGRYGRPGGTGRRVIGCRAPASTRRWRTGRGENSSSGAAQAGTVSRWRRRHRWASRLAGDRRAGGRWPLRLGAGAAGSGAPDEAAVAPGRVAGRVAPLDGHPAVAELGHRPARSSSAGSRAPGQGRGPPGSAYRRLRRWGHRRRDGRARRDRDCSSQAAASAARAGRRRRHPGEPVQPAPPPRQQLPDPVGQFCGRPARQVRARRSTLSASPAA